MKYTFLLPAYKGKFLKEAITSILAQTYKDFIILVSDDCSPDDIKSIVECFHDKRITYRKNKKNIGGKNLVNHWNMLVNMTNSEYLIMASDDDIYEPTFLEEINKLSIKYPEVDLIRARVRQLNSLNEITAEENAYDEKVSQLQFFAGRYLPNTILCIGNYVFKVDKIKANNGFTNYPFAWASDVITTMKMAHNGVAITQKILFNFRMSGLNISSTSKNHAIEKQKLNTILVYDKDFTQLIGNLQFTHNILNNNIYKSLVVSHKEHMMNILINEGHLFSFNEIWYILSYYQKYFKTKYYIYLFLKKWLYSRLKKKKGIQI